MDVLVNRVGYELGGPKRFVCRCDENRGPSARFEVTDGTGRCLLEGTCRRFGASGAGPWYYVGDFSAFRQAGGDFQIRFEAGGLSAASARFGVGSSLLWRLSKPVVLQMLRSSRASHPGPGEGASGWLDRPARAGSSLRIGARVVLALALAGAKDPHDPQIRSELHWGAEWLRRELLRRPSRAGPAGEVAPAGSADPEPHMALLCGFLCAKLAEQLADIDLLRRGERVWEGHHNLGVLASPEACAAMLLTDVALHVATMEPRYLASAERHVSAIMSAIESSPGGARPCAPIALAALAEFASSLQQHPSTPAAKITLGRCLDSLVEAASREVWGFVPPPADAPSEDVPMLVAEEAWAVLSARRATAGPRHAELATNALDWLLGVNPWGRCLLVGVGMEDSGAAGVEGAIDGMLVPPPGVRRGGPGVSEPPEGGPPHIGGGAAYLAALALL